MIDFVIPDVPENPIDEGIVVPVEPENKKDDKED